MNEWLKKQQDLKRSMIGFAVRLKKVEKAKASVRKVLTIH